MIGARPHPPPPVTLRREPAPCPARFSPAVGGPACSGRAKGNEKLRADYKRIAEHAGKYKARVAVARKLLTLVFYALRDGEVRCLETAA